MYIYIYIHIHACVHIYIYIYTYTYIYTYIEHYTYTYTYTYAFAYTCTYCVYVYAGGWKTARVVVLLFQYGSWVGWGGILTFMWLAYARDATLLHVSGWGLGGVGWDINVSTPQWWRHERKFRIYDLGVAAASKPGKPPPESAPRVRATGALQCATGPQAWSQKHLGDRRCPMLPQTDLWK